MADIAPIFDQVSKGLTDIGGLIRDWWMVLPIFCVMGLAFFLYLRHKKYPLRCVIWEKRGDDILTDISEKIGRVIEDGLEKYKLKKRKDTLPPVCYDYIAKSLGGSGCVHLFKYGPKQYKPVDVRGMLSGKNFEIIDVDDWNFKVIENRATMERRKAMKKFLETYLPVIVIIVCGIIFVVVAAMSYGAMKDMIAQSAAFGGGKPVTVEPMQQGDVINPLGLPLPGTANG